MKPIEIIEVTGLQASCDGGGGALGHPRVFLHIDQDEGQVVCPYCSRTYIVATQPVRRSGGSH